MSELLKADTRKTSNLLKKHLKQKFGIDCRIKSESYSGGSSINVSYILGPDRKEVESEVNKLQYGTFDAMTDCAGIRKTEGIQVDGYELERSKHAFTSQIIPEDFYFKLALLISLDCRYSDVPELHNKEQLHEYFGEQIAGAGNWSQLLHQQLQYLNFVTQDPEKITLKRAAFSEQWNGRIVIFYEYEGNEYNTEEFTVLKAGQPQQAKPAAVKAEAGEVHVIEYSDKSIAVIGDTYPIKEDLKRMGGKFNKFLSCGPGWIFQKSQMPELEKYFGGDDEPTTEEEQPEPEAPKEERHPELMEEVRKTLDFMADTDQKLYGQVMPGTIEAAKVQNHVLTLF